MNVEIFAEWLRRQNFVVIKTSSSYWYNQGRGVLQAFPYHWLIEPSDDELNRLLYQGPWIGLRYSTPVFASRGMISYHVILNHSDYSLETLQKKARHDVNKASKSAVVEQVSFSYLANEGWQLREDTLRRQGRLGAETPARWRNLCRAAEGLPGFEAWGVFVGGLLTASLLAFTCDDCCSILYQQSRTAYLSHGVNNLLAFSFSKNALSRPGISTVFYGLHSLDAPKSVDEFKFRMGYVAAPVRQRVVFHPWLTPFFNHVTYALLRRLRNQWPKNPTLAKVEGLVRFYLEYEDALTN
jgi:hypothetical protein